MIPLEELPKSLLATRAAGDGSTNSSAATLWRKGGVGKPGGVYQQTLLDGSGGSVGSELYT